jgi:hypothetical protein
MFICMTLCFACVLIFALQELNLYEKGPYI